MKAVTARRYGPAETLRVEELPRPVPGPGEVLIRVHAASVTTADWRLRAAAFPGGLALIGRLVAGLWKPRHLVPGSDVAGEIVALGAGVQGFAVGQRVLAVLGHGGHADYALAKASGALVPIPVGIGYDAAAALPFGALTALEFLREVARVQPGQRVLILGASGGVGAYAVQIAAALGAEVTAVAGPGRRELLMGLGASEVLDYTCERPGGRFDLIFDTVGALDWPRSRRLLSPQGLFLPLNFGLRELWHLLRAKLAGGPRLRLHVSGDSRAALEALLEMWRAGQLTPVIGARFPLAQIVQAHQLVETRHRAGAVILQVAAESPGSASGAMLAEKATRLPDQVA
ncbi:NAD(P)-dependent alcohol dehydrogenase [Salipiger sp. PrR002]|uniref:NAD(P)-dependent alcohol dehydrogenase n=1 Tax=Salipiger sp. PrR002 TaxID=2706489 RepID=UPI0013B7F87B|nr:NAD(P)-dependent alcohol dehydrogenase [Salipiger sp. PrR002]NDV98307.1 NAD(P)-dependent alcohol dehydrogenase [Salipiger sp. PrR002]NDW55019.1 NAD(P)-dependent alcohol dehydrogenase [Salipiger sp. PrR004]